MWLISSRCNGLFRCVTQSFTAKRSSLSTIRPFQFMCLNVPVHQVRKYPERLSTFSLHRYYLLLSLCQNNVTFSCCSTFHCSSGGSISRGTKWLKWLIQCFSDIILRKWINMIFYGTSSTPYVIIHATVRNGIISITLGQIG